MRKQWNVKLGKKMLLVFSLVAGIGLVQAEYEPLPQQLINNQSTPNMVRSQVSTRAIEDGDIQRRTVSVNRGLLLKEIPLDEESSSSSYSSGDGLSVAGPSTGVDGRNEGTQQTGGLQVQNVTVEAQAKSNSEGDSVTAADLLRRKRMRAEIDNETSIMQRLEEGRLVDERKRSDSIVGYGASVQGETIVERVEVPATPVVVAQHAPELYHGNPYVRKDKEADRFALVPFLGYRWFTSNYDDYTQFSARNLFVAGGTFEGRLSRYFSLEGSFAFGRDKFENNMYQQAGPYGYQGHGYGPGPEILNYRNTYEVSGGIKVGSYFGKVRPYLSGALGGMLQHYEIDDYYTEDYLQSIGLMRSTTQFFGNFGGGMDFNLGHNMALGGRYEYQANFSDNDTAMNPIWGDDSNRHRLSGNFRISF